MSKGSRARFNFWLGISLALCIWICAFLFILGVRIPFLFVLVTTCLVLASLSVYMATPKKMSPFINGIVGVSFIPSLGVLLYMMYSLIKPGVVKLVSLYTS